MTFWTISYDWKRHSGDFTYEKRWVREQIYLNTMNTKFLTIVSIVGVALFCVGQAQSQPPPTSVSTGRTTEQATRPEAPGGGHGQVWVNTEARVYHREGSPFYGTTSKGRYMTEQDAIQAGYKRAPKTP